jgi:hypothetical protein
MENEPSQVIDKLLYALFRDGSQSDSVLLIRSNHLATLVPHVKVIVDEFGET